VPLSNGGVCPENVQLPRAHDKAEAETFVTTPAMAATNPSVAGFHVAPAGRTTSPVAALGRGGA
jgi:hypothetical protein